MLESTTEVYSASVNPPRRAKRSLSNAPVPTSPQQAKPVSIQPKKTASASSGTASETGGTTQPAPAKRGRKPGPLSRSAREAQRRLNHSIIEKARRTKINDALATLKELVPIDYGQPKSPQVEAVDSDGEDDGDEYQPSSGKPANKPGKRQEKEKEFKLEILVRTVAYMKDLIRRVADLEDQLTPAIPPKDVQPDPPPPSSRKRRLSSVEDFEVPPMPIRRRRDSDIRTQETPVSRPNSERGTSSGRPSPLFHPVLEGPLPSISSWLPESVIDPRLLPPKETRSPTDAIPPYLPTPPSSTHFDPVRSSYQPPSLNLAGTSSSSSSSSSSSNLARTPEDESAASMLINLSTSPTFRPVQHSPSTSLLFGSTSPQFGPGGGNGVLRDPSRITLNNNTALASSNRRSSMSTSASLMAPPRPIQAQTPASLLGLTHLLKPQA